MRTQSNPFLILNDNQEHQSKHIRLTDKKNAETYNEDWLQDKIHHNPSLVPSSCIEHIFDPLLSVARELPCPSGFLDNLFVTPQGYLVLVECKLWKNPESRRKVIAQIMDYAKDFAAWNYDQLCDAINKANKTKSDNPLYDIVADHPDAPDEDIFVDAVQKNLKLGRHLLIILGDGIQENMEGLANHVNQHMSLHFTLGLVEIGIYEFPNDSGLLLIPSVISHTQLINRAVVKLEGEGLKIIDIQDKEEKQDKKTSSAPYSLSEVEFYERLSDKLPTHIEEFKTLIDQLKDYGVRTDFKRSLILRFSVNSDTEFGLGYIQTGGQFYPDQAIWELEKIGLEDLGLEYMNSICRLFPNAEIKVTKNGSRSILNNGKSLSITDILDKKDQFVSLVEGHINAVARAIT